MFGMFFAGLCTFGLFRMFAHRRYGRYAFAGRGGCGYGPRFGRFSDRGFGRDEYSRGWHRGGPRGFGRFGFGGLDLSPEQESMLRETIRDVAESWHNSQVPWGIAGEVASALTVEKFDRETFVGSESKNSFRSAVANAIDRLRAALDPQQRGKIAELLRRRFAGSEEVYL